MNTRKLKNCNPLAQQGFSLVEMMISITIGLMIVAALIGVLTTNANNAKTNDRTAELQSNGLFALNHLQNELRLAGYRGYTPRAPESSSWTSPAITNECGTAGNFVKNIRQAVWGGNDSNPFSASCIPAASYINGDVLVIRHAATSSTLAAATIASSAYLRSSYNSASVMSGAVAAGTTNPAGTEIFALRTYAYYIGADDSNAAIPALRRIALKESGDICRINGVDTTLTTSKMCDEMVVSGIEQMQVQYGVSNGVPPNATVQYFNGNGISGDHSATGATDWDKVTSVRIWLLARNAKIENGYVNSTTYPMGDSNFTAPGDSFRRQLFTSVVQLRNFRN
jgi:type IV pilus assembly protein PilW